MGSNARIEEKTAMEMFDRIDALRLDRREFHLWILALTVIFVLAIGVALLMYPTVFYDPAGLTRIPRRPVFFGFCGLAALLVGYFVDRQMIIEHLRAGLENEERRIAKIRREASADMLTALPGPNLFRDRLAMEFRRASHIQQPLSLLAVELKPWLAFNDPGETEIAFEDGVKSLMRRLRTADSIFMFESSFYVIILPTVNARDAYGLRDRLIEGLHDAAGASNRITFSVSMVNFPDHVTTTREMEESIQRLFLHSASKESPLEVVVLALGIH
jgi:GGDEF domain-containing protein